MFCGSCGKSNDEQAMFCGSCGAKLSEGQGNTVVATKTEEQAQEVLDSGNVQVSVSDAFGAGTKEKKRGGKKKIIIPLVVILVLLGGMAVVFARDEILFAVAPKTYVGNILSNTLKSLSGELEEMQNALNVDMIDKDDSFTCEIGGVLDSISTGDADTDSYLSKAKGSGIDLGVYYNSDKNRMIAQGSWIHNDKSLLGINVFLNDDELGVNIPELFDDYLTVPSKTFGQKWNNSELTRYAMDVDDDLDLSISNIKKLLGLDKEDATGKLTLTKETIDAINEAGKVLADTTKIGDSSNVKVSIGGKEKGGKKIAVTLSGKELKKYIDEVIKAYKSDKNIREQLDMQAQLAGTDTQEIYDAIDEIRDAIKENIDFDDEIVINLVECNGKFVGMSTEFNVKESDSDDKATIVLDIKFAGEKMINDVSVEGSVKVDDEKVTFAAAFKGNHVPDGGLFSNTTNIDIKVPDGSAVYMENKCELDLSKKEGNLKGDFSFKMDEGDKSSGGSAKFEYSGDYDISNGIDLNLKSFSVNVRNYYKSSYSSYSYDNNFKLSGSLKYKLVKGDSEKDLSIGNKVDVLGMDYEQVEEYGSKIGIEKKVYDLQMKIYEIFFPDMAAAFGAYGIEGTELPEELPEDFEITEEMLEGIELPYELD